MQFPTDIHDTYGDRATVDINTAGDMHVYLNVADVSAAPDGDYDFTPDAARALARALKQAANVAEGKPAKAPKTPKEPATFIDEDGDYWERQEGGTYAIRWSDGTLSHVFCDKSYAEAVLDHGRLYPVAKGNA